MAEKEIENIIRNLIDSLEKKDIDKTLSFFTDDAAWFTAQGTFKGREEIRRYVTWMVNTLKDLKFTFDGVGILIQGEKAVAQSTFDALYNGIKIKVGNVCTYEFSEDRIKNHWTIIDRLSLAQQAAKGPIERMAVKNIVAQSEKGLY